MRDYVRPESLSRTIFTRIPKNPELTNSPILDCNVGPKTVCNFGDESMKSTTLLIEAELVDFMTLTRVLVV